MEETEISDQKLLEYKLKYNLQDCVVDLGRDEDVRRMKLALAADSNTKSYDLNCSNCNLSFSNYESLSKHQTLCVSSTSNRNVNTSDETARNARVNQSAELDTDIEQNESLGTANSTTGKRKSTEDLAEAAGNDDKDTSTETPRKGSPETIAQPNDSDPSIPTVTVATSCLFCTCTFSTVQDYQNHIRIKHPYQCMKCNKAFENVHQSVLHTKMHIMAEKKKKSCQTKKTPCKPPDNKPSKAAEAVAEKFSSLVLHKCALCRKYFSCEKLLVEHSKTHLVGVKSGGGASNGESYNGGTCTVQDLFISAEPALTPDRARLREEEKVEEKRADSVVEDREIEHVDLVEVDDEEAVTQADDADHKDYNIDDVQIICNDIDFGTDDVNSNSKDVDSVQENSDPNVTARQLTNVYNFFSQCKPENPPVGQTTSLQLIRCADPVSTVCQPSISAVTLPTNQMNANVPLPVLQLDNVHPQTPTLRNILLTPKTQTNLKQYVNKKKISVTNVSVLKKRPPARLTKVGQSNGVGASDAAKTQNNYKLAVSKTLKFRKIAPKSDESASAALPDSSEISAAQFFIQVTPVDVSANQQETAQVKEEPININSDSDDDVIEVVPEPSQTAGPVRNEGRAPAADGARQWDEFVIKTSGKESKENSQSSTKENAEVSIGLAPKLVPLSIEKLVQTSQTQTPALNTSQSLASNTKGVNAGGPAQQTGKADVGKSAGADTPKPDADSDVIEIDDSSSDEAIDNIRRETTSILYKCTFCERSFLQAKMVSLNLEMLLCVYCNFTLDNVLNYSNMMIHHKFNPLKANVVEILDSKIETEIRQDPNANEVDKLLCRICQIKRNHCGIELYGANVYVCNLCKFRVRSVSSRMICMVSKGEQKTKGTQRYFTKDIRIRCGICKTIKPVHEISSCGNVATCKTCNDTISSLTSILSHINNEKPEKEGHLSDRTKDDCTSLKCNVCRRSTSTTDATCSNCKAKMTNFVSFFDCILNLGDKPAGYQCSVCSKCNKLKLVGQLVINDNALVCMVCSPQCYSCKKLGKYESDEHGPICSPCRIALKPRDGDQLDSSDDEGDKLVIDLDQDRPETNSDKTGGARGAVSKETQIIEVSKDDIIDISDDPADSNEQVPSPSTSTADSKPKIYLKSIDDLLERHNQRKVTCNMCKTEIFEEDLILHDTISICQKCKDRIEAPGKFACYYCIEVFQAKDALAKHKDDVHLCHLCTKYRDDLRAHHLNIIKCQKCLKMFCKKYPLSEHYRYEHQLRWCSICNVVLANDYEVLLHRGQVHKQK